MLVYPRRFLIGLALATLGAAAYVESRRRATERENPPQGAFLEVDGVRLHYVERGRGTPLVLLHGNTVMGLDFVLSGLVERAAERYRVIVIDRPGYGYSDRPRGEHWGPEAQARLIRGALARLGAEPAIVLGHSWGALVAAALALDYPQSVRGLVLEAGYLYPRPRPDVPLRAPHAIPLVGDLLNWTIGPLVHRALWPLLVKLLFAPAPVPAHFWRFPAWMAFRPSQLRASGAEMAEIMPAAWRLSRRYRDLAVPVAIIAGRDDQFVHEHAHSANLHRDLPRADYRLVEGAGHMLHHLAPEAVLDAIAAVDRKAEAQEADFTLEGATRR